MIIKVTMKISPRIAEITSLPLTDGVDSPSSITKTWRASAVSIFDPSRDFEMFGPESNLKDFEPDQLRSRFRVLKLVDLILVLGLA